MDNTDSNEVEKLLSSEGKLDSISAQLLLREAYELTYYLYNHDREDSHPFALVLNLPQENYSDYGTLYRTFYSYERKQIFKRFGLNIQEFLAMPREYVELIFRICDEEALAERNSFEDIKNSLEQEFGE